MLAASRHHGRDDHHLVGSLLDRLVNGRVDGGVAELVEAYYHLVTAGLRQIFGQLKRACEEGVVGGGARPGAHLGVKLGPALTATLASCFIVLRRAALCCVLAVWVSVSVVTVLVSV